MSLHIVEWDDIRSYDLFHTNGERGSDAFKKDLKMLLGPKGLYVEETVVVYRPATKGDIIDEYLRERGLVFDYSGRLQVIFLPVHKNFKTAPVNGKRLASRIEVTAGSANYVGDVAADYVSGREMVMHSHEDHKRRGDGLIVYGPTLHDELVEALAKLGVEPMELQRPYRFIKTMT